MPWHIGGKLGQVFQIHKKSTDGKIIIILRVINCIFMLFIIPLCLSRFYSSYSTSRQNSKRSKKRKKKVTKETQDFSSGWKQMVRIWLDFASCQGLIASTVLSCVSCCCFESEKRFRTEISSCQCSHGESYEGISETLLRFYIFTGICERQSLRLWYFVRLNWYFVWTTKTQKFHV